MEAPVSFKICNESSAMLIVIATTDIVFFICLHEVIVIYKIVPRVIRGVYIDEPDSACIGATQDLESIQIVAFDV